MQASWEINILTSSVTGSGKEVPKGKKKLRISPVYFQILPDIREEPQPSSCLSPPQCWGYKVQGQSQVWVLGIWTQILLLEQQTLPPSEPSCQSSASILKELVYSMAVKLPQILPCCLLREERLLLKHRGLFASSTSLLPSGRLSCHAWAVWYPDGLCGKLTGVRHC